MQAVKFGVVIPYFQRKPGLLRGALESIKRQRLLQRAECAIQVVVVDDSSPHPVGKEIEGFECCAGLSLTIHGQPNAGAGAARNSGLQLIEEDCHFIAFLDSDDEWDEDHLETAAAAFRCGADFYFCDAIRHPGPESENALVPEWFAGSLTPCAEHTTLNLYSGDADLVIVKGLVPTTSTIVHRRRAQTVAFPSRYFRFGEDQYYCLSYVSGPARIAYSTTLRLRTGSVPGWPAHTGQVFALGFSSATETPAGMRARHVQKILLSVES